LLRDVLLQPYFLKTNLSSNEDGYLLGCIQTTWRYNTEDSHLLTHHCENLKSYLSINVGHNYFVQV
jgi:hypothetical protein